MTEHICIHHMPRTLPSAQCSPLKAPRENTSVPFFCKWRPGQKYILRASKKAGKKLKSGQKYLSTSHLLPLSKATEVSLANSCFSLSPFHWRESEHVVINLERGLKKENFLGKFIADAVKIPYWKVSTYVRKRKCFNIKGLKRR